MSDNIYTLLGEFNTEFYSQYFELLINRLTHSTLALEPVFGDPNDSKNALRLHDNMEAFKILLTNLFAEETLDIKTIVTVGDRVNESVDFISRGFRKSGDYIVDTNIKIPKAEDIELELENLLIEYVTDWEDDETFLREAKFHIDFIRMQPFEDGNHRTANHILNYNLLKKGLAPVIITEDLREFYQSYINEKDYERLANLFKIQSLKEREIIDSLRKDQEKTIHGY